MTRIYAENSAVIDAKPEEVYAILSDYRNKHPLILPRDHFRGLEVEEGGQGAGTVFRVRSRSLGVERALHMRVSEPEQGRVLVETDMLSNLVTTFTVTPVSEGRQARLSIATEMDASPGIMGLIERLLVPSALHTVYGKELRQLASVITVMCSSISALSLSEEVR